MNYEDWMTSYFTCCGSGKIKKYYQKINGTSRKMN